ncbi:hypothetical protein BDN70DRAFT_887319 [Pholiota conissans]|uniref:Uncharacterized protein n=1 Tax=Pholiota conissans TaxID=109636 RepID=A0A9P5YNL9_9AGAR|nr:hypothetical protein BDN70DRAFT_887319 [Pholiota conissans]
MRPSLKFRLRLFTKPRPHLRSLISRYGLETPSSLNLEDQLQQATLHHIGAGSLTRNRRALRSVSKFNMIIDVHASNSNFKRGGNGNSYASAVDRIRAMAIPMSLLFNTPMRRILKDIPRRLFIETSGHL